MMKAGCSRCLMVTAVMAAILTLAATHTFAGDKKASAPGIKKRVIVGTFEDKAEHNWYHGASPGDGMADMLITALVKSGKFKVFERAALSEILKEKNLSMSDLANPGVEAGNKLSIGDFLVKATITEFGYKEKDIGGGIAGKIGGKLKNYSARIAVDLRIINIGSSEVMFADAVDESESSKSIGIATNKLSFGDKNRFDDHVVGKATRKVINKIVDILADNTKNIPWTGILITAEDLLFIDAGTEIGITNGMQFDVLRQRKVVKHPKTGKILKVLYDTVGVIQATEAEEGVTTATAISGAGFQNEDLVKPHKRK